jgi:hypothetical protein
MLSATSSGQMSDEGHPAVVGQNDRRAPKARSSYQGVLRGSRGPSLCWEVCFEALRVAPALRGAAARLAATV